MERILFIINPVAGGGRTKKLVPLINDIMAQKNIEYDIVFTTRPKEGTDIAKEGIEKGYRKIVAVGGDGTVNEVAFGIVDKKKGILGILPSGTGNDLARALNIPLNPKDALNNILKGYTKNIDVCSVNDGLFLNISSIGFDAEVAKITENIKTKIKSSMAYVIALFIALFKFKFIKVEMEIDDSNIESEILLIAVGNGNYYGGGINILPMASLDDGHFHVCVVKKVPKLKLLFLLPTIINGSHINQKKYVSIYKAKNIKVRTKDKAYINIDGEIVDINKEALFSINNTKLTVIAGS